MHPNPACPRPSPRLQDKHSAELVRLRGDGSALRAEVEQLRRAHGDTDSQFRTLYSDK